MTRCASVRARVLLTGASILLLSRFGTASTVRASTAQKRTSGGQTVVVTGVVRDASGGGWALYARVDVGPAGAPEATAFTDPATGAYAVTVDGAEMHHFTVQAVSNGYAPVEADVPTPGDTVRDFDLSADLQACTAPGYVGPAQTDFSAGVLPIGWSLKFVGTPWEVLEGPDPCGGYDRNLTGGTGPFAVVSFCDHAISDTQLRTPTIDLSQAASAEIHWNNDYADLDSIADVDVSTDGGSHWTNVWERSGIDERGPGVQTVDLTAVAAGQPSVQARFRYQTFFSFWWQVDNVFLGEPGTSCQVRPGGLVVGTVRDANTGGALNAAAVAILPDGAVAHTFATPDDPNPNQDDGLYILFAPAGDQSLEATHPRYASADATVPVVAHGAVRQDFALAAGSLAATPRPVDARVLPGETVQQVLTLSNGGAFAAGYTIGEVDVPLLPSSPPATFASREALDRNLARLRAPAGLATRFDASSALRLPPLGGALRNLPTLPAGRVIGSFSSGVAGAWGIAFDTDASDLWLSNIAANNGDNRDYRLLPDGTFTGDTIDENGAIGVFAADGAYNPLTKTLWRVDAVGIGSSCIFELDPAALTVTGNRICPETGTSERGLAYDPTTDTYYIGSWNDGAIKRFSSDGTLLESAIVNEPISGLAYNPTTRHLFTLVNIADQGHNVIVYDTANAYAIVGAFPITDASGADVLVDGAPAGLDADCDGNLWVVDQVHQTILQAVSGERGWCPNDIAWLTTDPASGTVDPEAPLPVTLTFDSAGLFAGLHQAQLQFRTDTPYSVAPVGVDFTVRFRDVAENDPAGTDPYAPFVYGAAGAQIMPGCDQNGFLFCPNEATSGTSGLVIRADMAAYVWKAVHGAFAPPPVYTGIFTDVNPFDRNADYIQGVYDDGITAGCQLPGEPLRFCPQQTIPRGQMAVFIEKGKRGAAFVPPPCTGVFGDVSCPPIPSDPYGDWVELLWSDGITAGCQADPTLFCPGLAIPNEQMAVFLVRAFSIPFLP
ncbi:MAG TPA: hypothetical protein VGK26_00275 [Thermoanaerobaculia bacterium]|jgi:hypothetical protein